MREPNGLSLQMEVEQTITDEERGYIKLIGHLLRQAAKDASLIGQPKRYRRPAYKDAHSEEDGKDGKHFLQERFWDDTIWHQYISTFIPCKTPAQVQAWCCGFVRRVSKEEE